MGVEVNLATKPSVPSRKQRASLLLTNNLYKHSLAAVPVELPVKDLFPWAEVEFAFGDGDDDFAAHDLAFEVGVCVVFAGAVVMILAGGSMRGEFFEPDLVIVMEAGFVVVDENRCGDVHRVDEDKAFFDAAFFDKILHGPGNVDETDPIGNFKGEILG
jgi:hypothetical protein